MAIGSDTEEKRLDGTIYLRRLAEVITGSRRTTLTVAKEMSCENGHHYNSLAFHYDRSSTIAEKLRQAVCLLRRMWRHYWISGIVSCLATGLLPNTGITLSAM